MVILKYSEVPLYLRDSGFYQALVPDDPDASFEVPTECYRESDNDIKTIEDFENILNVMTFWNLKYYPQALLNFCFTHAHRDWYTVVAIKEAEFKLLRNVFQLKADFSLQSAIETKRPEFITFWLSKHDRESLQDKSLTTFYERKYGVKRSSEHAKNAITQACRFGLLDLVEMLRDRGFEWDSYAYCAAALHGLLPVLEYLHKNGCPLDYNAMVFAARGGQLDCMKYLYSIGCMWDPTVTLEYAMQCNQPNWYSYRLPWTENFTINPTETAYIDCLRFALENGCTVHQHACTKVVGYGLLDCLELLEYYGGTWNEETTASAAECGSLACLTHLHEHGCPWNAETTKMAARFGHIECLQYAFEEGCPYYSTLIVHAAVADSPKCLKYLIEDQNLSMNTNGVVMDTAFSAGRYENIQYLIDIGYPVSKVTFGTENMSYGSTKDADLAICIQLAIQWNIKICEKFLKTVTKWDKKYQRYQYPLCNEIIHCEYVNS